MGWDSNSSAKFRLITEPSHRLELINPEYRDAFKKASDYVKRKAATVDWLLEFGGLDCSACAEMLEEATGESCWGPKWNREKVQKLNSNANWDFDYDPTLSWAYWSARKYLETCAKLNLIIKFSW